MVAVGVPEIVKEVTAPGVSTVSTLQRPLPSPSALTGISFPVTKSPTFIKEFGKQRIVVLPDVTL